MSIEDALGFGADIIPVLTREHWAGWRELYPELAVVPEPEQLWDWVRGWPADQDRVLLALARLAHVEQHNDTNAAKVLAAVLIPQAVKGAAPLTGFAPKAEIDALAAQQLWIEVRTFTSRTNLVGPNITWRVRTGMKRELGLGTGLTGNERLNSTATPVAPDTLDLVGDERTGDSAEGTARQLREVLDDAVASQVITAKDRAFLDRLIEVADQLPEGTHLRRGTGHGLLSAPVAYEIAGERGITERRVRQQGTQIIGRLSAAHRTRPTR